jgi:hypothetical protein
VKQRLIRLIVALFATIGLTVGLAACETSSTDNNSPDQKAQVDKNASKKRAYIPTRDVELNNYNRAQQLYDQPDTIQWCTFTFSTPSSPIITVPIAGKLTSSSTTFFNPNATVKTDVGGDGFGAVPVGIGAARSVDGLYHPNPAPYRFGFTPGGQYADFTQLPTFCTTALSSFQRQSTQVDVSIDPQAQKLTDQAEAALRNNDPKAAQAALQPLASGK